MLHAGVTLRALSINHCVDELEKLIASENFQIVKLPHTFRTETTEFLKSSYFLCLKTIF